MSISLPKLRRFSTIGSSNMFSVPFTLLLEPYNVNISALDVVPRSLKLYFLFTLFFLCSASVISSTLPSISLIHSSVSFNLLLVSSSVCFISVVFFISA